MRAFDPSFGHGKKVFGRQFAEKKRKKSILRKYGHSYRIIDSKSFYTIPLGDDYLFNVFFSK